MLRNLRECMHLNNKPDSQAGCAASQPLGGSLLVDDGELFDDADSVDDLDFGELLSIQDNGDSAGLGQAAGAAGAVCTQGCGAWEAGTMMVRTLDWLESLQRMGPSKGCEGKSSAPEALDAKTFYANDLLRMDAECTLSGEMPPGTDMDEQFEVIIGTDIMYEPVHARLVAAVLAHRLAAGGAALMVCAVRQARTFAAFAKECAGRGLRYRTCQVSRGDMVTVDMGTPRQQLALSRWQQYLHRWLRIDAQQCPRLHAASRCTPSRSMRASWGGRRTMRAVFC